MKAFVVCVSKVGENTHYEKYQQFVTGTITVQITNWDVGVFLHFRHFLQQTGIMENWAKGIDNALTLSENIGFLSVSVKKILNIFK